MKKVIAALSAVGLALGMASALGATTATATVRPHVAVFTVTVSQATGLSTTSPTSETLTFTNGTASGTVEYGFCNDDASSPNPLKKAGACTPDAFASLDGTGSGSAVEVLTPGKQGTGSLSGCPMSKKQLGLGVACIAAAADLGSGATSDAALYFGTPTGKATGTGGGATLSSAGPFATAGLYGPNATSLTTGCQSFSAKEPKKGWTPAPLCDDGANVPALLGGPLLADYGFATGEPVEVFNGAPVLANLICDPTLAPGAAGACPYAVADQGPPVTNPGSVSVDIQTAYGITLPKGTYPFTLVGASSGVAVAITVKVSKTGKVT